MTREKGAAKDLDACSIYKSQTFVSFQNKKKNIVGGKIYGGRLRGKKSITDAALPRETQDV